MPEVAIKRRPRLKRRRGKPRSEDTRCIATTKAGTLCKNAIIKNSELLLCPIHDPSLLEKRSKSLKGRKLGVATSEESRCVAITKSGNRCTKAVVKGSELFLCGSHDPVVREKRSKSLSKAMKEASNRPEVRHKLSKAMKGKKHSVEAKRKIGKARKGKKHSLETIQKISEAIKKASKRPEVVAKISGENHPMFNDWSSLKPYAQGWQDKELHDRIRKRDGNRCQGEDCGKLVESGEGHIHHIDGGKDDHCENNLILLCVICHLKQGTKDENYKKRSRERFQRLAKQNWRRSLSSEDQKTYRALENVFGGTAEAWCDEDWAKRYGYDKKPAIKRYPRVSSKNGCRSPS